MLPTHRLLSRVFRKFRRSIAQSTGRDELTFHRVTSRDDLQYIGTDYGGWVIPATLLDRDSICYCAGCGEDISFDLGLIRVYDCHIFGFDPTPRAIKYVQEQTQQCEKYHFFPIGLWDTDDLLRFYAPMNPRHVSHSILNLQKTDEYFEARAKRLSEVMRDNGHVKLDLLKLDVEGAEYRLIDSIIEDKLTVTILCVEYDECFNPLDMYYEKRVKESVDQLIDYGYSLVCARKVGNYTFLRLL